MTFDHPKEKVDAIKLKIKTTRGYKFQIIQGLLKWLSKLQLLIESVIMPKIVLQEAENKKLYEFSCAQYKKAK